MRMTGVVAIVVVAVPQCRATTRMAQCGIATIASSQCTRPNGMGGPLRSTPCERVGWSISGDIPLRSGWLLRQYSTARTNVVAASLFGGAATVLQRLGEVDRLDRLGLR